MTELTAEAIIDEVLPDPGQPEILYRSDNLEVRRIVAGDGRDQIVTFESYHDDAGFERNGFGQAFFAREGFTAIHVLSAGNDWYQYPELAEALAAIRTALTNAERVLAYGSSMGGYAAVRFGDAIGATHVLALSPQYSIDPRRVPADRRWWWDQKRIRFLADHNGAVGCGAETVIAFDPMLKLDRLHAELIAKDVPARFLRLPYAGHPVTTMLSELGLLQAIAVAFARGPLDLNAITADFESRREQSSVWLAEYAAHLPETRKAEACDLAARAVAIAPTSATIQHQFGIRLHEVGRYEEAIEAHRRAVAISPHPIFILSLSRSLFHAGALTDALEQAEAALRNRAFDSEYHRWTARVRLALGDRRGALKGARTAFTLARTPRNLWSLIRHAMVAAFG